MAICAALLVLLAFATLVHLSLFAGMRPDLAAVFLRALILSSLLAAGAARGALVPRPARARDAMAVRRRVPLGRCIATALALPFNTAFFRLVDAWVAQNPSITEILGPDAPHDDRGADFRADRRGDRQGAGRAAAVLAVCAPSSTTCATASSTARWSGVGFNWFEAALYVAQGYAEHGVAPFGLQLGVRYALFGLGGHAMFTAHLRRFLGLALQTRRRWLRIARAAWRA